jgi:two-component SAPR family response regulator
LPPRRSRLSQTFYQICLAEAKRKKSSGKEKEAAVFARGAKNKKPLSRKTNRKVLRGHDLAGSGEISSGKIYS